MSLRYLLDTDTCSYAVMGHPRVFPRLDAIDRDAWAISSLVRAELEYGLAKGKLRERSRQALSLFLDAAPTVSFDRAGASQAALVRAHLESIGRPAGAIDQMIAGHALALQFTLVTANQKLFADIPGLALENWAKE